MKEHRNGPFVVIPLPEPKAGNPHDETTIYRAAIVLSIHLRVTASEARDERKRA